MEKVFVKLEDLLVDEVEKVISKNDINPANLDALGKAVDIIKDVETIMAMQQAGYDGYSETMPHGHITSSYARGRDANTGRYISRRSSMHHGEDGYSAHSIKDRMIANLESLYDEAGGEHEKQIIDQWINRLEMEK